MQADIEYIRKLQAEDNYRFEIIEVGGQVSKVDRIRRLIPYFESGRVYLPTTLNRTLYDKSTVDLINVLVEEELMGFPVALHDDLSDAMARLFDLDPVWPKLQDAEKKPDRYTTGRRTSWMAR
jgi:phage terminase large subunit-like protein